MLRKVHNFDFFVVNILTWFAFKFGTFYWLLPHFFLSSITCGWGTKQSCHYFLFSHWKNQLISFDLGTCYGKCAFKAFSLHFLFLYCNLVILKLSIFRRPFWWKSSDKCCQWQRTKKRTLDITSKILRTCFERQDTID